VPQRSLGARVRVGTVVTVALMAMSLLVPSALAAKPTKLTDVQLLAINDFHGNLQPPSGSGGRVGSAANDGACTAAGLAVCQLAGGVEYLATKVHELEATNPDNTLVVAAGDLIGATPLVSAAFHDEPTIEAMNALGLDITSVGNHEFDEGVDELLRMQNGGCHPVDGCQDGDDFAGADFQFLAANVVKKSNGKPIFPAYKVRSIDGAKVGFIGLTLEGTPNIVSASGIQSVDFLDEAETINKYTAELQAKGVHTIVVLIHEGGAQTGSMNPTTINSCNGFSGAITDIVNNSDNDVDLFISGHSHQPYSCVIDGRPVTSAFSFGRLVTDVDMTINQTTGQPTSIAVNNVIVPRTIAKDPAETTIVNKYVTAVAPIANVIVGSITADITQASTPAGESALGDVIADAQLEYTQSAGAQLAFMNPGGIRANLVYSQISGGELPGQVTFGEAFTVQPFNNLVTTQDMTGAQIKATLEQSWLGCRPGTQTDVILQVSSTFNYTYNTANACGSRITSMTLNGVELNPTTTYKVAMNNFLADGGDSFTGFRAGTNRVNQPGFDVDALTAYLGAHAPVAPGPQNRITKAP
jgi:5'-nucleotidase